MRAAARSFPLLSAARRQIRALSATPMDAPPTPLRVRRSESGARADPASAFAAAAGAPAPPQNGGAAPPARAPPPPPLELAPSMRDLILDPATPRTPGHREAEIAVTTGQAAQVLKRHMDAVVKVLATHSKPDFELPWQVRQQHTSKSTGFAIRAPSGGGERWLLTNAHSVTYATSVQLKRRGDDEKFAARVLAVGTDCDLALLAVNDDAFWEAVHPLELSEALPELQDAVAVVGYPIGGDSLAISAGVVSRVQLVLYSFGCMSLLALQTDAAINSGNSGGPVLNAAGEVVGLAFQSLAGDAANVGYVIPTSVVRHFLDDVRRNGRYTGFPSLNVAWQELESRALKAALGCGPRQKGVLVRSVVPAAAEARLLKPDDVLLAIDGVELGNDGTVPFRHGERVDFRWLVTSRFVGDVARVDVLRAGEALRLAVPLSPFQHLVPPHYGERRPSYFMCGGLVFTACQDAYLKQRYGSLGAAPVRLMGKTFYGTKAVPGEEVVLLSNVLACDATRGYETSPGLRDAAVAAFNGARVRSLVALADVVARCEETFLRFDLEAGSKVVVLDAGVARRCAAAVMEEHAMKDWASPDVLAALAALRAAREAGAGTAGAGAEAAAA